MSFFGNFINDNASSLFGSIAGLFTQRATNRTNLNMMRETNQFNAQEAAKQRDWEARQAEIARDWQEDFYNTYESPEAMVRQYQGAGLNPALLYQGAGSGSAPSASIPSGSAASGTTPPYMDAGPLLHMLDNLATLKTRIENMKSATIKNRADVAGIYQGIEESKSRVKLNNRNIEKIDSEIDLLVEQAKTESEKRNLIIAQTSLNKVMEKLRGKELTLSDYRIFEEQYRRDFYEKTGFYPANTAVTQVIGAISRVLRRIFPRSGFVDEFTVK